METVAQILAFVQGSGLDILTAALAVIGGLKVIARYTPWAWDDKALELVESPLTFIRSLLPKGKQ